MDTVKRFSNRVENYVKYRPHYPTGMLKLLEQQFGINNSLKVADIGSGTGISSMQFVDAGYEVYGVDPNDEMRGSAERIFSGRSNFISINGSAENSTLTEKSIDIIMAGQAFHWFDKIKAKEEFQRILKPVGIVLLIWNKKKTGKGFMDEYFGLLRTYGTDYDKVKHENFDTHEIKDFFQPNEFRLLKMNNSQSLDYDGIEGRLLSSSYIPLEGPAFEAMISGLKEIYQKYNNKGIVTLNYETVIYGGSLL